MSNTIPSTSNAKVHFMGIGGSGMGAVALLAQAAGFEVEGSDLLAETPYLSKVKAAGIPTYVGHDVSQLKDIDILAVSPAVFFNPQNEMLEYARGNDIPIMTWQEFMGTYLHKGKKVICVAGSHGKSTSTALLGVCLEEAKLDPTVEVGATVSKWESNIRIGSSDIFVTEADEFYDNFLHYHPEIILLTNIEYEHPDYFKNEADYFDSYVSFVSQLSGEKRLIVNLDDGGVKKLVSLLPDELKNSLTIVGFSVNDNALFQAPIVYKANVDSDDNSYSQFEFLDSSGMAHQISLSIPGKHNVSNALGVLAASAELGVSLESIILAIAAFNGIGRRLEVLGEQSGITVIDDYAHHPTAIKASLQAIQSRYPEKRVLAIIEPHSYSRTKAVLDKYKGVSELANNVIIAPIFKARDTKDFGINEESLCSVIGSECQTFSNFDDIVSYVKETKDDYDIVIVMGAGKSHALSRDILKTL